MWILAGLGNPGEQYEETRHNYGFLLVDWLCRKWDVRLDHTSPAGVYQEVRRRGHDIILLKPMTFMNRSGLAVKQILRQFQATPAELLVAHDDLDLEFGTVKIRKQCGPGSHNGVLSIMEELKTENFPRIRLGIGPRPENWSGADFVLAPFEEDEVPTVKAVLDHTVSGIETLLARGFDFGMNQVNRPLSPNRES